MKLQFGWIAALAAAAWCLSGCTTTQTVVVPPSPTRNYKLTVVESPLKRTLTPQETEQLRTYVLQYLLTQGPVRNDTYTVRIDFPPEVPGAVSEYMVVQLTAEAPASYTVLNNYSDPWYYDPYDVRYSYVGLFGLGYAYYDQFYYDHNRYYRPIPPPVHYTRPHPPGNGRPNTGRPHPSNPTSPDAPRHRPQDPDRYAGDRNHPTSAKPNVTRPPTGTERTHRPPPTETTQRRDPGRTGGGIPPSGKSAPVGQSDPNRTGGHSAPPRFNPPPPPPRESPPARETAASNNSSGDKRNQIATEQEK